MPSKVLKCNGCTVCCQGEQLILHPEEGDDLSLYRHRKVTAFPTGLFLMEQAPNGDCCYLERGKGCTIYDHRPIRCRQLDCRVFLNIDTDKMIERGLIREDIIEAARTLHLRMATKVTPRIPGRRKRTSNDRG